MSNDFQILIDSDAFIGWMLEKDAHHHQATEIFDRLIAERVRFATTSFVVGETATVLSHRKGQSLAKTFLDEVIQAGEFPVIFITEDLHREAIDIFKRQTQRGTSLTDCANVAVVRQFNIPTIFSFDQVYPKKYDLPLAAD